MAKKKTSTKLPAPDTRPKPALAFRIGSDNMGGFMFALMKADGTLLMYSGPTPYKTRKAAMGAVEDVMRAITQGDVPVLDAVKDR